MGKTASLANIGSIADSSLGFRNRIINGAMVIDQRNAGAAVTPGGSTYTLDRWGFQAGVGSKFTIEQKSTYSSASNYEAGSAPAGFSTSLKLTVAAAYTPGTTDAFNIGQYIEGLNVADLNWGTASAQTIAFSFWVKCSVTGTYSVQFGGDNGRGYIGNYTVNAANTWEYKTIVVPGDTSGTYATNNTTGLMAFFSLGAGSGRQNTANVWTASGYTTVAATGSTNLVTNASATWYITGVQLEKGSTATSFDYRPYGTELQLCQRYAYPIRGGFSGFGNGTTVVDTGFNFPVEMRSAPSLTQGTLVYIAFGVGASFVQSASSTSLPNNITQNGCILRFNNFTLTANSAYVLAPNATTTAVTTYAGILTAEL